MKRRDPTSANNAAVRKLASRHRLRTEDNADGEVVVPCGPGRASIHLGFGYAAGLWYVCAIDLSARQSGAILAALDGTGCRAAQLGDAEFVLVLPADADPLAVLDRHEWTRPRRRKMVSEAQRVAMTARLADLRRRSAPSAPPRDGTSRAENRAASPGAPSEPSGPLPAAAGPPADEVRP